MPAVALPLAPVRIFAQPCRGGLQGAIHRIVHRGPGAALRSAVHLAGALPPSPPPGPSVGPSAGSSVGASVFRKRAPPWCAPTPPSKNRAVYITSYIYYNIIYIYNIYIYYTAWY